MTAANFVAYAAQVALVVIVCAGLPHLLAVRAPGVQYLFWRLVLIVCLALPFAQPVRPLHVPFASAGVSTTVADGTVGGRTTMRTAAAPGAPIDWVFAIEVLLLAGVGMRLGWLAIGVARLDALRRRSGGTPAAGFDDLQDAIGTTAPILWSAEVRHPVTFGLLRPVVLLPAPLKSVDRAAQRAVVAHELHHVKRRDWAWVIGEEVVRSIFWFHPAMWWLISRVQLARETVVDELSILVTNARRTYLDTLLAFADDTGLGSSTAFSARRHLFHRVMLLSKEGGMSSSRIAVVCGALIVALGAGTWSAVNAFPLYGSGAPAPAAASSAVAPAPTQAQPAKPPRDPRPPERPQPPKAVSIAFTNANLVDVLTMFGNLTGLTMDFDRGLAGRVTIQATEIPWDEALRRILQPLGMSFTVQGNTVRVTGGSGVSMPPPPPPPPPPGIPPMTAEYRQIVEMYKPIQIGGEIKAPIKTKDVKPAYPADARTAGVQGVVIIEAVIDPAGQVAAARILRSIPALDDAAMEAVRQWEFTPTLMNGVASAVMMTTTVNFTLR